MDEIEKSPLKRSRNMMVRNGEISIIILKRTPKDKTSSIVDATHQLKESDIIT